MALTLFVVGVLAKYAGVADKIGKNFDYIMAGGFIYLLGAVVVAGASAASVAISGTGIAAAIGWIIAVAGFVAVAVGTLLGAYTLIK
ncbi:MAG: hypothetical protein ACE5G7_04110 [Candidatus Hydrothermarchaeaceae archaeon]